MKNQILPVLVTGVGGGSHGAQILKALRYADTPYWIVGTDINSHSSGLVEVDQPYLVPPANDPRYISSILKICKKHDIKAVFHGSEPELKVLSENRKIFEDENIFLPLNPEKVIKICMDKIQTSIMLKNLGFNIPRYKDVSSIEDALCFDIYPAVLKPSVGSGGSANTYLIQHENEMRSCISQLLLIYDSVIIQEYVGTPDAEYTVGVLCDMQGLLINSIAVRRYVMSSLSNRIKVANRTDNKSLGPVLAVSSGVSQGEIGRFPKVTSKCEEIATSLGVCGAVNIQCRLVGDKVYVFEINPRFSGTTSLRAMVGYNEPDLLVRKHILGEEIEKHFTYREGVILRSLKETLITRQVYECKL